MNGEAVASTQVERYLSDEAVIAEKIVTAAEVAVEEYGQTVVLGDQKYRQSIDAEHRIAGVDFHIPGYTDGEQIEFRLFQKVKRRRFGKSALGDDDVLLLVNRNLDKPFARISKRAITFGTDRLVADASEEDVAQLSAMVEEILEGCQSVRADQIYQRKRLRKRMLGSVAVLALAAGSVLGAGRIFTKTPEEKAEQARQEQVEAEQEFEAAQREVEAAQEAVDAVQRRIDDAVDEVEDFDQTYDLGVSSEVPADTVGAAQVVTELDNVAVPSYAGQEGSLLPAEVSNDLDGIRSFDISSVDSTGECVEFPVQLDSGDVLLFGHDGGSANVIVVRPDSFTDTIEVCNKGTMGDTDSRTVVDLQPDRLFVQRSETASS